MVILHIGSWLEGAVGTLLPELVAHQTAAGHEVEVVLSNAPFGLMHHRAAALERLRATGARVIFLDDMRKRHLKENLRALTHLRRELGRVDRFDVIHCHAALPSVIALLLA